jgi:hypothetical protein
MFLGQAQSDSHGRGTAEVAARRAPLVVDLAAMMPPPPEFVVLLRK